MGGRIGFGMAKYAPHRLDRLVLGGGRPYTANMEVFRTALRAAVARGGGDATAAAFEQLAGPTPEPVKSRLRKADAQALLAATLDQPTMEDVLPRMTMPCCLYAGEGDPVIDPVRSASEQIPNAQFFSLPGLSHWEAFKESGAILPRVLEFLSATG